VGQKKCFSFPGIEIGFVGRPARTSVTKVTELSHLVTYYVGYRQIIMRLCVRFVPCRPRQRELNIACRYISIIQGDQKVSVHFMICTVIVRCTETF